MTDGVIVMVAAIRKLKADNKVLGSDERRWMTVLYDAMMMGGNGGKSLLCGGGGKASAGMAGW